MVMRALIKPLALVLAAAAASAAPAAPPAPATRWIEPHTGMPFVALPKGCFQMGSSASSMNMVDESLQPFRASLAADEQPRHEVCVDAFQIGQFEVRASDWVKVMGENPPYGSGMAPAGGVSYNAAQELARRLTQLSAGEHLFRLPTEAEWEYACRAGQDKDKLPLRDNLVDVAWYSVAGHRIAQPSEVGRLEANAWGLYDMLGNVWEWVADGYQSDAYARHALYNPLQKGVPGGERVIRGASHRSAYIELRCANRSSYPADDALSQIGLRLVRIP